MNRDQIGIISKNPKLLKQLINRVVPLSNYIDTNVKTCFCPFHQDTNKPSAQIYHDEDGTIRLYCFSENKQYGSYDYLKLILGVNPISYLFNVEIAESIIEEEQERQVKKEKQIVQKIQKIRSENPDINSFFTELYKPTKHF